MSPFYANYCFHPQTEWIKERETHKPGAELYAHWMQKTHLKGHEALDQTQERMKKYYDRKVKQEPDIAVDDVVRFNAKKMQTKRPTKKVSPKLY